MGYFSSDKQKQAKGARCKFSLMMKTYISTYVGILLHRFIFHFKCVSCLKSDIKTDLPCLEPFEEKNKKKKQTKKNEPYGFPESGPLARTP